MTLKNSQIFISYKKKDKETPEIARQIEGVLKNTYGYQVFLDINRIPTAEEWERVIYDNIHASDVLIVLLEPETATSEWVQREVDVARGALVSILPLAVVDPKQINLNEAMEKLALRSVQHSPQFKGTERQYADLVDDIERLTKKTRDAQKDWMRKLDTRWRVTPPLEHTARYKSYTLRRGKWPGQIHLAVGDILRMGQFDVIVNSENAYMQMARYYEYMTLSSMLRRQGSLLNGSGHITEDAVQDELDAQINILGTGRPIMPMQVIATNAGHPQSKLRRKARYIFHAATVQLGAEDVAVTVQPIKTPAGLRQTVCNCLDKVFEVNTQHGVWPAGKANASDASYEPIKSIIFPIFGTGQGGVAVTDAAPAMVEGIFEFLMQNQTSPAFTLQDIHLCILSTSDIAAVEKTMDRTFEPVPVPQDQTGR